MTKPIVFISYSSRDADLAQKVEAALEHIGFEAYNPARDIPQGADWREEIQAAIKRADALVILAASPQYLSSSWTSYEAGIAETLGKRVMVLLPSRYPITELPAEVATGHILDFDPQAPERAAHDIASRLAAA